MVESALPLRLIWILFSTALLMLILASARPALAERMVFHNIYQNNKAIEHQLSGINHIVQDEQGFMWFGSEKGLARYDGGDTKIYRHDPRDPYSIAHNFIHGLLVDGQGVMWIATGNGLCYYQAKLDRFSCEGKQNESPWPKKEVLAIALDRDDNLYFSTGPRLYRIGKDRKRAIPLSFNRSASESTVGPGITSLAVDRHNTLWVGTDGSGLISMDSQSGAVNHYPAGPIHTNALAHNRVAVLAVDRQDRLWIGTYGGGLSILDSTRTLFENHIYRNNEPGTLSSNIIWDIFIDGDDNVWLAVDQGGLVRFDDERGFLATRHKPYDATSLASDQVRTIYEDRNGDLWLGAFPSGVSFHNRATGAIKSFKYEPDDSTSLSHSSVLTIHQDHNDNIWIGTEDGLNLFDPLTGTFTRYQFNKGTALTAKAVLSLAQYDENTLWVGTWSGGLLAFDLHQRTFRPIDVGALEEARQNSMFIWDILRDSHSNMWLATEFEGVGLYDRSSAKVRFFSRNPEKPEGLPRDFVWAVMEDRQGAIWIATNGGLAILRPGEEEPTLIKSDLSDPTKLQAYRIIALYEDEQGRVWIGTQDNGAFVYHPSSGTFQHIGIEQGLPPGISSGFIEDAEGNVWILTTNGLVRVNTDDYGLKVYGTENGLSGNTFNRNAALRTASGLLYIGSADGLNIFDPKDLGNELREFPVWITTLRVLNEEVKASAADSPLQEAIHIAQRLDLSHRDSMFSFDFAALDYRHSQDTRYAYMLKGFDQNWNYIGARRSATYTNIPAGDYTFYVKASSGKNSWIENEGLSIHIAPAPWLTWWAYLSYALVATLIGYFFIHYFQLRGHTKLYKNLSATDALTGIANRMGVSEAAQHLLSNMQEPSICLLFIDVDHFKRVNDTRGHDSGDRVLIEVAEILQQCSRRSDLIGRWGGEEFLLIYTHVEENDCLRLAEDIQCEMAQRLFDQHHSPLKVTLSIGCAFIKPGEQFEAAIKRADCALYQAKNAGRNCAVLAE